MPKSPCGLVFKAGSEIDFLKEALLKEVSDFCSQNHRQWKLPVETVLREIKRRNWRAAFFGGTLRTLLLSRILVNKPGRPRDVDIVVAGQNSQTLEQAFERDIIGKNRFGGLHLRKVNWEFDVWPLHETFAFKQRPPHSILLKELPYTTFFNIEAIAVEVFPISGRSRQIFSGNDQFFRAILNRTLEINIENNPFPHLCVIRALVLAAQLKFKIGVRLLHYIANHGASLSESEVKNIQLKHYGKISLLPSEVIRIIYAIQSATRSTILTSYAVPFSSQLTFWPEDTDDIWRIRMKLL